MAQAAAFKDPRFSPVTVDEFDDLDIEISVLTPLSKIDNVYDIEVGRHGIYLRQGMRSGLLLPQVATENHWDRLTFLQYTCRKAGLPSNAWQDKGTEIYTFSADIF
jgi:AmmeMemoRadiSam system protein A